MNRTFVCSRASLAMMSAVFFLVVVFVSCGRSQSNAGSQSTAAPESVLDKVKREGELRIGFSGYPPFLNVDPNTKLPVSGFSVELIQAILAEWNRDMKIVWVPTNWTQVRVDLLNNKFDLIVEPVFRTIPRAAEVAFSRPYSFFAYAVGLVRAGDSRFKKIDDINVPSVTVSVMQGGTAHEYAKKHLPNANLKVMSGGKVETSLDEVLFERVDIALADLNTIRRYVSEHPGKLETVFTDPPPGRVPAGFMFRQGDYRWAEFLNACIDFFDASGEIQALKQKYGVE